MSGANSRRIRKALKPLLGEEHLSKSAVSRVVSRLKERFEEWQNRALSEEVYAIVYLDGFHLKVRMAKRVISVPVLVALGVAPDGQKRLLSLRLAVSEASTHWGSMLGGLQARGLRAPKLVISDGHKGLTKALEKWPGCRLQRCTEHKRANLLEHCPAHARRELRRDYNRTVYAKNGIDARKADTDDFCQEFPAKRLTLYREPMSLVVREAKLPPAKPSFEDSVLLEQVDDSRLLVTLDPTSDADHQPCQGLHRRAHDRGF